MPTTLPEDRAATLKAEHQRLEQYLRTLSPKAWESPSNCDKWTVADVIAHITLFNRDTALRIIDSLQAEPLKAGPPKQVKRSGRCGLNGQHGDCI